MAIVSLQRLLPFMLGISQIKKRKHTPCVRINGAYLSFLPHHPCLKNLWKEFACTWTNFHGDAPPTLANILPVCFLNNHSSKVRT